MGLRKWLGLRSSTRVVGASRKTREPSAPAEEPVYRRGDDYWQRRQGLNYYRRVRELCDAIKPHHESIVDIGSNGCPQLDWFPTVPRRVSIDLVMPYQGKGIESVTGDFLSYVPADRFDLGLCLQVLEHIEDPAPFARHILTVSRHAVVSVPYLWPEGATVWHCQDPVDEAKMQTWFGRAPDYSEIVAEESKSRKNRRLICHYHTP